MPNSHDIFAISDLHIGDGGDRDNFGCKGSDRPEQVMAFLDYVEKEGGELVIVGDLLDFWQSNFSRVLTADFNSKLIQRLGQMKAAYIIGNHDIDLIGFTANKLLSPALFQNIVAPITRTIGGKTFHFMHGHEVDPYNCGETPSKGRMLTIFAGMCEDFVGSPNLANGQTVEDVLEQTAEGASKGFMAWVRRTVTKLLLLFGAHGNYLSPAENEDRAAQMLLNYKAHREQHKYDVLIVGHTHKPGSMDGWYFNTGSWATTNNNFARITPSGDVQLFDWSKDHAVPNTTVLSLPEPPKEAKA